ncbi:TerC family protein [Variovorax soli]|uniref:YjbE family integral membrane protein n=1 Tax=Variovorax soli TaxID=376815 RepID=A0ABU1NJQ0_9BURK|nr:TerC family protein [Variovorax soli]MDR6538682.1 YjbE family integral membrane protein [Variovorax soli]
MSFLSSPEFWIALSQIILINIVLSGDNAVVIAMASRSLPPAQQKKAIVFGSIGAIVLRVILTFFAVYLLTLPYLKLVGAALLLWIGVGLLQGEDDEEGIEGHSGLAAAIKTIVLADLVMSLDNVVGVAAAAKGNVPLLVFGLVISIPLIIFGSTLILKLMDRFPVIIVGGAALLGWVAGEMAVSDPAIAAWVAERHSLHTVVPALGAMAVVAVGKWLSIRSEQRREKLREKLQAAEKQPAV